MFGSELEHAIEQYGYVAVGLVVAVESVGIPLPGEATLIAAGIYAGKTGQLHILLIIAAAAAGAIAGDNLGFLIGRTIGFRLLVRFGRYVGLSERRIKLGQYLFLRHGGKVVLIGRFVAVLRAFAAVLAGAHGMGWRWFLLANATGGVIWAAVVGGAAYLLGDQVERVAGPVGIGVFAVAALMLFGGLVFVHRHERQLTAKAERALPGPVTARPVQGTAGLAEGSLHP